ncbi:MAG: glycosyltransferase family 2 protein [Saprospiraceae bacterium]
MVSAVIIARNESANIERVIESVLGVVSEVIVVDSGSTDGTQALAKALGARVLETEWKGYGATKNWGAEQATNPWILSLDADEELSEHLRTTIGRLSLDELSPKHTYGFKRLTQFCGQWINNGAWSRDVVWRIYHRDFTRWSTRPVHETLEQDVDAQQIQLAGELNHYSFPSLSHYQLKHDSYAQLGAEALYEQGKKATWVKRNLASFWRGFKGYVVQGGWRDGAAGWQIAKLDYLHVKDKYQRLRALWQAR